MVCECNSNHSQYQNDLSMIIHLSSEKDDVHQSTSVEAGPYLLVYNRPETASPLPMFLYMSGE